MLKITEFEPEETEEGLVVREVRNYTINARFGNLHGFLHDLQKLSEELDIPSNLISLSAEGTTIFLDYKPTGTPLFRFENVSDN